ncbi:MAG: cytochrome c biogenesis protein [Syntrophales bacterium]|jgi:cytochrome c-type biogenesis protein CcsB|nr:cytochrome c biogenesis protein [Syntrophales bacterium]MDY0044873.1 cytochrome c biogenesis protein [Syntrophales bacterium]
MMVAILFKCALAAYLASTAIYAASLAVRRIAVAKAATWVLMSAFALHTIFIAFRWVETGQSPVISSSEAVSFVAWAIVGLYLAFQIRTKTRVLGAFVAPIALILVIGSSADIVDNFRTPEMLNTSWVTIHVILSLAGGAFFALACVSAFIYLVQDKYLKKRKIDSMSRFLPPLRDLDRINHISVIWGFMLLTAGIVAGVVWARTVWGTELQGDPKQVATLVSWLMCALLVHQRLAIGWKGKKAAFLSIGAFVFLLFAFVGVNLLFATVHSF